MDLKPSDQAAQSHTHTHTESTHTYHTCLSHLDIRFPSVGEKAEERKPEAVAALRVAPAFLITQEKLSTWTLCSPSFWFWPGNVPKCLFLHYRKHLSDGVNMNGFHDRHTQPWTVGRPPTPYKKEHVTPCSWWTDTNDHGDYRNDPIEVDNEVICFGSRQPVN